MKQKRILKKREKFCPDPRKTYLKKIRIYPSFLYARLDRWLKAMSASGWHVVHAGLLFFWFEKGKPMEKEYFTYEVDREERYSLPARHPFLEEKYGVKRKRSKINANESKAYLIVEIDLEKVDVSSDIGYKELISDRNRLHWLSFMRIIVAFAISTGLLILVECLRWLGV